MKCDNCKRKIKFTSNQDFVPINIIKINNIIFQFCNDSCYNEFIDKITYKVNMDRAGHFLFEGGE